MPKKTRHWVRLVWKKCPVSNLEFELQIIWHTTSINNEKVIRIQFTKYLALLLTSNSDSKTQGLQSRKPSLSSGMITYNEAFWLQPQAESLLFVQIMALWVRFSSSISVVLVDIVLISRSNHQNCRLYILINKIEKPEGFCKNCIR